MGRGLGRARGVAQAAARPPATPPRPRSAPSSRPPAPRTARRRRRGRCCKCAEEQIEGERGACGCMWVHVGPTEAGWREHALVQEGQWRAWPGWRLAWGGKGRKGRHKRRHGAPPRGRERPERREQGSTQGENGCKGPARNCVNPGPHGAPAWLAPAVATLVPTRAHAHRVHRRGRDESYLGRLQGVAVVEAHQQAGAGVAGRRW